MASDGKGRLSQGTEREKQLEELLASYVDRLHRGEQLDPEQILADHPTLGQELLECLEGYVDYPRAGAGEEPLGTLGDYTLRRKVGSGGMGVVYEAWQNSLDRHVALKVLPAGVAADTKSYSRFLREAQIAAKLNHPSIVAVYGFGVESNTPYYAMEFVEGETLAQILDPLEAEGERDAPEAAVRISRIFIRSQERAGGDELSVDEKRTGGEKRTGDKKRSGAAEATVGPEAEAWTEAKGALKAGSEGEVAAQAAAAAVPSPTKAAPVKEARESIGYASLANAFADVADALHHAHSRGVIHRDIKPSNLILDRGSDAGGASHVRVRILDFGLARLEGQERLTASGEFLGTPIYVSPEQAQARKIPIDHRTDIYSLGATMYELLTLRPPFKGRDYQDTLSQIISKDPSAPRGFNPRVPRDLETIVLKCLRKAAQDRYGTAEALAQDLRRFARGEPIEAQPQPAWEKWARRFWRHRGAAIAAAVMVAIALAAFAASSFFIWKEQQRTQKALDQVAAQRVRADRNFRKARAAVDEMLSQVGQSWLVSVPGMEDVRRLLLQKALRFYQDFLAEEGEDPEVRREAGRAQLRMGDILFMLGRHAESEAAYREAIARSSALASEWPDDLAYRHDLARAHAGLADLLRATGRHEDAKKSAGAARDILASLAQQSPAEGAYREDLASAEGRVGKLLWHEGKHDDATSAHRRAIEIRSGLIKESPSSAALLLAQATSLADLSAILGEIGVQGESKEALDEARALAEKIEGEARESAECILLRARMLEVGGPQTGRAREEALRESLSLRRKLAEDFPRVPDYRKDLAGTYFFLAAALQTTNRYAETEEAFGECLALLRKLVEEHPGVPLYKERLSFSLTNYGGWLRETGKAAEAIAAYRDVVRLSEELARDQPESPARFSDLAMHRSNLAAMLMSRGEDAEAEKEFLAAREVLQKLREEHPKVREYPVSLAMLNVNLAHACQHEKRLDEAEQALREALSILETKVGEKQPYADPRVLVRAHLNLGDVLAKSGRMAQAEESFQRVLSLQERMVQKNPESIDARAGLADFVETIVGHRLDAGMDREAVDVWPKARDARIWLSEQSPRDCSHPLALGEGHERIAAALRKLGEVRKAGEELRLAEESYRKALALAPENVAILQRLARRLISPPAQDEGGPAPDGASPAEDEGSAPPGEALHAPSKERAMEAARLAAKALEIAPESAASWNILGVASYRLGDWKKSIDCIRKALELGYEGGPGESLLLGMACWQLGDKAEAVKWQERALDSIDEGGGNVPMDVFWLRQEAEALLGLRELESQRYLGAGDFEKGEEALRDVVRFWEKLVAEEPEAKARSRHLQFACCNLGQLLKATGRLADAEEFYRKAVALAPDDPLSQMLLAWLLAIRPGQAREKIAEALQLAAKAAKTAPEDERMWWALGLACHRSDRWTQAIEALEKSLKLSQGDAPKKLLVLAMARWNLGKKDEARKSYDEAIELLEKEDTISSEMQGLREEAEALLGTGGDKEEKSSI